MSQSTTNDASLGGNFVAPNVFPTSQAIVPNERTSFENRDPNIYQAHDTGLKKEYRDEVRNTHLEDRTDFDLARLSAFGRFRYNLREYFAEFLGTLILVTFGDGAVALAVTNENAKGSAAVIISLGFAFALMLAVYIASPVSGAHVNPAITVANALLRGFPWKKVPGFIFSQLLGAFCGACLVMLFNYPAIDLLDSGVRATTGATATAGIFATYPAPNVTTANAFFIEMLSTAFLLIGILGINDERHGTPSWLAPIGCGFTIGAISFSTGWLTGFALNPARDLGPRLFTMAAGWGTEPFTAINYYFWVPLIAPFFGAIFGILVYDFLVAPPIIKRT